tara:strand:+ start:929 stop:1963 length:1035 start_codon:yes stop_codon:yes gene_type:complete
MAERIIMNDVKKFEWESLMSMTGNKISKFNAIDKNLNCSQLMRNAELDWTVSKVPVQATIDDKTITSDKLYSLVKSDDNKILVSGLTNQYHVMQNEKMAQLGDMFYNLAGVKFEHCINYKDDKVITFLANTGASFNIGDDQVKNYLMLTNFHTGRDKGKINTTNVNPICENTYMVALSDIEQFYIGITHRVEFNNKMEDLIFKKISDALKSNKRYKEQAETLNSYSLTESDMLKYFILVYNPKLITDFDKSKKDYSFFNDLSGNKQIKSCYGIWHDTYENNGTMYKLENTGNDIRQDTLWKAFNCITYNEDHLRAGDRVSNTFITNGKDNIKDKAMQTALQMAA